MSTRRHGTFAIISRRSRKRTSRNKGASLPFSSLCSFFFVDRSNSPNILHLTFLLCTSHLPPAHSFLQLCRLRIKIPQVDLVPLPLLSTKIIQSLSISHLSRSSGSTTSITQMIMRRRKSFCSLKPGKMERMKQKKGKKMVRLRFCFYFNEGGN